MKIRIERKHLNRTIKEASEMIATLEKMSASMVVYHRLRLWHKVREEARRQINLLKFMKGGRRG